ncbi:MAG: non-ribosomal peptide synthetase [Terriglobales bacterium]|jgi:amino acid adenylation domain-containing protein
MNSTIVSRTIAGKAIAGSAESAGSQNSSPRDASTEDRSRLLAQWNNTATEYPRHLCIHQVFEQEAARRPEAVAVRFENEALTYRELNERANQLAHRLRDLGVGPEAMVGTVMERSLEMVIALLGILKAGGAFVPLDMNYPAERLAFMASDTKAPVLVVQKQAWERLSGQSWLQAQLVAVDGDTDEIARQSKENPANLSSPESLAYVMYTSGSTGRPKGVMVPHRAVVRLVKNTDYIEFTEQDVFLQFSPVSFDASTLEIWGALLNGGCVAVASPSTKSLEEIGATIRKHGVTTAWLTAGLFNLMVEQRAGDLKPLRQLLAGGDALSVSHVKQALQSLPNCRLVNGYGPTEGTTFTCCRTITVEDAEGTSIPIGRPIANTQVYILDANGCPVAVGEEGELYVGGDGVARGYLNQPELTVERFVPNPFGGDSNAKLYRTGDLACYRADGTIEFRGRIDQQIKISGYRIEPGEIEATLTAHPEIKSAVVVARHDGPGQKKLVAYVVPQNGSYSATELRTYLEQKLPPYMLPSALMTLDVLPLSPNGKLDRDALPLPDAGRAQATDGGSAAKSELEGKIAAVWAKVLRLSEVGLEVNFFDIGGDSLSLLEVHAELQKVVDSEIQVVDLFHYTTVRSLAKKLGGGAQRNLQAAQDRAQQQRAAWQRQKANRTN